MRYSETEISALSNTDSELTGRVQASNADVQAASGTTPNSNTEASLSNSSPSKQQSPQPQRQQRTSRNSPPVSSAPPQRAGSTPQPQRQPNSHHHGRQRTHSGEQQPTLLVKEQLIYKLNFLRNKPVYLNDVVYTCTISKQKKLEMRLYIPMYVF